MALLFQFDILTTHAHTHTITISSLVRNDVEMEYIYSPARTHAWTHQIARGRSLPFTREWTVPTMKFQHWSERNGMRFVCMCADISNWIYSTNTPIKHKLCVCVCVYWLCFPFFSLLLPLCMRIAKFEERKKRRKNT